jgi:D-beta-D-heptose 7-phosphate kinase/D-beta-D-heptose 1-phosphate adenosyltransferase
MLLSENGEVVSQVPTYAREVFDVSGAGDTVIAALSVALATGASMLDAIHFANTAAGFVVGKLGTATATPEDIISYAAHN